MKWKNKKQETVEHMKIRSSQKSESQSDWWVWESMVGTIYGKIMFQFEMEE